MHRSAAISEKWVVVHLSGWDPHVSMKWKGYLLAKASPSHSSSHLQHSLSLLTQEQPRTLKAREGRDWRRDWRRWRKGRREALAAAHGHLWPLNPFMVSSRSSYLVQSSNEFMDSPLNHLFFVYGKREFIWTQTNSWIRSKSGEGLDLQPFRYGSSQISELRSLF
jgi:hypothetical protein